jgi:hypothetical protein
VLTGELATPHGVPVLPAPQPQLSTHSTVEPPNSCYLCPAMTHMQIDRKCSPFYGQTLPSSLFQWVTHLICIRGVLVSAVGRCISFYDKNFSLVLSHPPRKRPGYYPKLGHGSRIRRAFHLLIRCRYGTC